jgi:hypothetical protein
MSNFDCVFAGAMGELPFGLGQRPTDTLPCLMPEYDDMTEGYRDPDRLDRVYVMSFRISQGW